MVSPSFQEDSMQSSNVSIEQDDNDEDRKQHESSHFQTPIQDTADLTDGIGADPLANQHESIQEFVEKEY